jgi:hypothetical protein
MMRIVLYCVFLASMATLGVTQDKPKPSAPPKQWKIMRDKSTNDCILMKITASHPGYPDQLETYETEEQGKAGLEKFKKQDDPDKAGYEMCTNK